MDNDQLFISVKLCQLRRLSAKERQNLASRWETVIILFDSTDTIVSMYDLPETFISELISLTNVVVICNDELKDAIIKITDELWDFHFSFENKVLRMMGSNRFFKVFSNETVENAQSSPFSAYFKVG